MAGKAGGPAQGRRDFISWILGTSMGGFLLAVLYPVGRYLIPPAVAESTSTTVTLPIKPDEVLPNTGQVFKFGSRAGLLIRTASGEFRAFSAACPHLGCIVQYREDLGRIWCACHNGHFDLSGRNIQGPPPGPLEDFEVNVRGDQIVVSRDV
jgi:cytochrome b6-f complex iron-sulfur subunit